jgi:RNase P/RNase MRP subunit p29
VRTLPAALVLMTVSCGYHVAGHSDLLPKSIKTICIPPFGNATVRYKLTDQLPEAIAREFIARTRYKIVSDPNTADVVLRGVVTNFISNPVVTDTTTGRATAVDVHVYMQITLTERTSGKVLYSRQGMESRGRYEVSVDPRAYFDESDAALARVAKSTAQQVVTGILSNF